MKIVGKNKGNGQSLVEFALSLPLLLIILSGLLDLGRIYYTYIALEEAAAEAAIYLAISPDCPNYDAATSDAKCQDPNNALYRAATSANGEFDTDPDVLRWNIPFTSELEAEGWRSPFSQNEEGTASGDCDGIGCTVVVQLEYDFELLTPGMQTLLDNTNNSITLSVQASQVIVYDQR
jgi:hypothetical protein